MVHFDEQVIESQHFTKLVDNFHDLECRMYCQFGKMLSNVTHTNVTLLLHVTLILYVTGYYFACMYLAKMMGLWWVW
jgi:hypothetical protein